MSYSKWTCSIRESRAISGSNEPVMAGARCGEGLGLSEHCVSTSTSDWELGSSLILSPCVGDGRYEDREGMNKQRRKSFAANGKEVPTVLVVGSGVKNVEESDGLDAETRSARRRERRAEFDSEIQISTSN